MKVKDIMKQPYVFEKDISFREAAHIMSSKNVGSLIFMSKNKIKGIITDGDILKKFSKAGNVSSIMSKDVVTISPDESIDSALILMRDKKIKHLPVVEDEKLLGIITATDIAAHADLLEEEFLFN